MRIAIALLSSIILAGCSASKEKFNSEALKVIHSPNPSNIHVSHLIKKSPYPYMWYYSTEIVNKSDRDLKIIWFESYSKIDEHWYSSNALKQTLRNKIFLKWYREKDSQDSPEWLKPNASYICDTNWHGSDTKKPPKVKWAYIAIDKYGNDYFAASVIESIPIK